MYALQAEPERKRRPLTFLAAALVALGLQGGALAMASRIEPPVTKRTETVRFTLVEAKKPAPKQALPPPPAPAAETPELKTPEPERIAKPEPKKVEPKKAPEPKKMEPKKAPEPKLAEAEAPPAPPADPAKPKPRFIPGLSMASTVSGGAGPAFGVGNTAMGDPSTTAADARTLPSRPSGQGDDPLATGEAPAPRPKAAPVKREAKLLKKVLPRYPKAAREEGVEGEITLVLSIDADGKVKDAKVVKGLREDLDQAALEAARATLWTPATVDGAAIECQRRFQVNFQLEP